MADSVLPARPPGPHPTPEQLYRARNSPRTAEAERWLAHAGACALCTEELLRQEAFDAPEEVSPGRLAGAWERFGEPVAPRAPLAQVIPMPSRAQAASPRGNRAPRAGLMLTTLAASCAIAAVGLGLWTHAQPPESPRTVLRGGTAQAGAWQPSGLLGAPPTDFVFPDPQGEPRRVSVFDATHTYTWTSPSTTSGRVSFPAGERQRLQKGVEYFWTVVDDEGAVAQSFRVR
jgi:hypothetical protein